MGYTEAQARIDVDLSLDWELARKVSLKKWRQIASQDPDDTTYTPNNRCGYCFVAKNHAVGAKANFFASACSFCPAIDICTEVDLHEVDPGPMIAAIEILQHTEVAP